MRRFLACASMVLLATVSYTQVSHTVKHKTNFSKGFWSVKYDYLRFKGTSPLVKVANEVLEHESEMALEQFVEAANDTLKDEKGNAKPPQRQFEAEETPVVALAMPRLISTYISGYQDTSGAHPTTYNKTYVFGYVNSKPKKLVAKDLFKKTVNVRSYLTNALIPKLRAQHASNFDDPSVKTMQPELLDQFIATKKGLEFLFSAYDVGSYAEGPHQVTLTYKELAGKLDPNGPLSALLRGR